MVPRNLSRQDRPVPLWFLPLAGREAERAWMLTNDASYRLAASEAETRGPRSLFRRGFQEQGICGFGMSIRSSVVVARPRLLGSHKSVLLLSRSEFIRLDSAESSSPRQKRSRPVTESQTIYSPLHPLATLRIYRGFRIPNIFASWIGPRNLEDAFTHE